MHLRNMKASLYNKEVETIYYFSGLENKGRYHKRCCLGEKDYTLPLLKSYSSKKKNDFWVCLIKLPKKHM